MTDGEKAKEYWHLNHNIIQLYDNDEKNTVIIAYKDELAEGRKEKWHEIKCCSQELPSRSKDNYLHSVIVSNEYGEPIYYDYNIDEWCDMESDIVSEGCNYWCELPKFEE